MAEAHQAVHVIPEETYQHVKLVYDDEDFLVVRVNREAIEGVFNSVCRQGLYLRNELKNSMFPNSWVNGFCSIAMPPALMLSSIAKKIPLTLKWSKFLWSCTNWSIFSGLRESFRVGLVSAIAGTVIFVTGTIMRRYALRGMLGYQRWLYEPPRKQSYLTYAWYACVRMLTGRHPLLYCFQRSLPRLPVPPLQATVDKYVESVRSIYDEVEMKEVEDEAVDFMKNEGPMLQRYLILKSWISDNYITDWWEKYIYLRGRDPIMINSNYYISDIAFFTPTNNAAARAGSMIWWIFKFKEMVENETLEPMLVRDTVPMCMEQYKRLFGTCRVPGLEVDELKHYSPNETRHIVVHVNGIYLTFDCYSRHGKLYRPDEIATQINRCIQISKGCNPTDTERRIGAFTAGDRTTWAEHREKFFSAGANQHSLSTIEKAAFIVNICNEEPDDLTQLGHLNMHGSGYDRWFDKSFNLNIYANGKMGMNVEHSWADAPVMGHLCEYAMLNDAKSFNYNSTGGCIVPLDAQKRHLSQPAVLQWSLNSDQAKMAVQEAVGKAQALISEFELKIQIFDDFGKGMIKKCKVSPDAFIQAAFQMAFYKLHQLTPLTYEASMTRLFQQGRTETVRSASLPLKDFVLSCYDDSKTKEEQRALFTKAAVKHQSLYRDAMTGKGIDRHLFGLYVVSQGKNVDSQFLKHALSEPWRLSTSQQPQSQVGLVNIEKEPHLICPGGGFGPVAKNGYGVSYMVAGEGHIFFHVSSNKTYEDTSSETFANEISDAFRKLADILSS